MPDRALRIFIYTFCAIGVLAIVKQGLINLGLIEYTPLTGFAQNQNALAFQGLMVICAILCRPISRETWFAIIPLSCCILSGSRTAIGTSIIVFMVAAVYIPRLWPRILGIIGGALIVFAAVYFLSFASALFAPTGASRSAYSLGIPFGGDYSQSNAEHRETILVGLKMFLNHPFFGNGMGTFAAEWKGLPALALSIRLLFGYSLNSE